MNLYISAAIVYFVSAQALPDTQTYTGGSFYNPV